MYCLKTDLVFRLSAQVKPVERVWDFHKGNGSLFGFLDDRDSGPPGELLRALCHTDHF
jgi:hypothetical protein